jgi:hypothetical protein
MLHRKLLWIVSLCCFTLLNCLAANGHAQAEQAHLPAATTAQPIEWVDTRRLHWAYEAMNLLCQTGVVGACPDTSGKTPLSRRQFATLIAPAWWFSSLTPSGANHTKSFSEALAALRREFRDELVELTIRTFPGKPPLDLRLIYSSPLQVSLKHPVLADLATRLWPVLQSPESSATIRIEDPMLHIEKLSLSPTGTVATPTKGATRTNDPQQLSIEIWIGAGKDLRPVTLPQNLAVTDGTTYLNCYELGIRDQKPRDTSSRAEYVDPGRERWVFEALNTLASAGIIESYPGGTFRGSFSLTRYDVAVAIARLLNTSSKGNLPPGSVVHEPGDALPIDTTSQLLQRWRVEQAVAALRLEFAPELRMLSARIDPRLIANRQSALRVAHPDAGSEPTSNQTQAPAATVTVPEDMTREHAWLTISYGKDVDPKLVERIKQTIADYAVQSRELAMRDLHH